MIYCQENKELQVFSGNPSLYFGRDPHDNLHDELERGVFTLYIEPISKLSNMT